MLPSRLSPRLFVSTVLVIFVIGGGCDQVNNSNDPGLLPQSGATPLPAIDGYTPTLETTARNNGPQKGRNGYQVNWPKIKALLKRTRKQTGSKFAGFYSLRDSSRDRYFYRTTKLSFSPEALREAHGKMRSFFLRTSRDSASTLELFAGAIPDSKKAMDELSSWISSKKKNSRTIVRSTNGGSIRNRTLSGLQPYPSSSACYEVDYIVTNVSIDENGKETLVSVTVYYTEVPCGGGGGGGGGDFGGGGDPVPCSQQIVPGPDCPSDCDNSQPPFQPCLDGGGGNPTDPCDSAYPPEYCNKPKPCNTGNSIIDDKDVQEGLNKLWDDTNYGSDDNPNPESQRKEQAGFIISNLNGGYIFQQFPESAATSHTPCSFTFGIDISTIPEGAIYVHTHPYSKGEVQNNCPTPRPVTYRNHVGVKDRSALTKMGVDKGIIIDANEYTFYKKNGTNPDGYKKEDRCGY